MFVYSLLYYFFIIWYNVTIEIIFGDNMEKLNKLIKNLKEIETKILQSEILLLVYDEIKHQKVVEYLLKLLNESKKLLVEYSENKLDNIYNYIDNNCFEMEQLVEDLKVELERFIKVDAFVFLHNKTIDELYDMLEYYKQVLDHEGTMFNASRLIKQYANNIISDYVNVIKDYLEKYESPKVQSLLNVNFLESIINHYLITSSDWSQVYKTTKFTIKSIENKTSEFNKVLTELTKFEYAYFLVMVGD